MLVLTLLALAVQGVGGIHPAVTMDMSLAQPGELIPVVVHLEGSLDPEWIEAAASGMTRAERQQFVVNALQSAAILSRTDVLKFMEYRTVERVIPFWLVNGFYCETDPETIRLLAERPDVVFIDQGAPEAVLVEPVERRPAYPYELDRAVAWGVEKINAPDVWALGYEGQGVIVGVIDTGVDYTHSDLASNMWHDTPAGFHYGYNFYGSGDPLDPMDDNGHGTHCAGTVAGMGTAGTETGVAPSATVMALRIYYYTGGFPTWIQGMEFAAEHGASVLSMSLGTTPVGNATLRTAEENVLLAGIYHSVAAANSGPGSGTIRASGDCPPPWFHPDQAFQGGQTAVVTVGATDSNDAIASFSSRGPVTWWLSVSPWNDYGDTTPLIKPDISGPGVDVLSAQLGGGYTTMSGTSMATPHLAGVAALLLSINPELTVAQLDSLIETTSLDLGTAGKDNTYGAGRVDVYQAALAALEMVGTEGGTSSSLPGPSTSLSAVQPNPANTSAAFSLYLPVDGTVSIVVFDVAGRAVAQVHSGQLSSGSHSFLWNLPENIGNGLYFVRATAPGGSAVTRMTVLR
jgi:serine protease AprX